MGRFYESPTVGDLVKFRSSRMRGPMYSGVFEVVYVDPDNPKSFAMKRQDDGLLITSNDTYSPVSTYTEMFEVLKGE